MTADQAETYYYEQYRELMRDRDYDRPIVQQEIRQGAWQRTIARIEAEYANRLAADMLDHIERDAK